MTFQYEQVYVRRYSGTDGGDLQRYIGHKGETVILNSKSVHACALNSGQAVSKPGK